MLSGEEMIILAFGNNEKITRKEEKIKTKINFSNGVVLCSGFAKVVGQSFFFLEEKK